MNVDMAINRNSRKPHEIIIKVFSKKFPDSFELFISTRFLIFGNYMSACKNDLKVPKKVL